MNQYIEINDLVKTYNKQIVLNIKHLEVRKGEVFSIVGESGCGKSTLARLLLQLEKKNAGIISFNGQDISKLLNDNRQLFRRTFMCVFQNPFNVFDPRWKVMKSIISIMKLHHIGKSSVEQKEICKQYLNKVGLGNHMYIFNKYPRELSGGQLQRLSLMLILILQPEFIIADEPTSMLDLSLRTEVINLLISSVTTMSSTLLFISHDLDIVFKISTKIAIMYKGRIVEVGEPEDIIGSASHPYTKLIIDNFYSVEMGDYNKIVSNTISNEMVGCCFLPYCSKAKQICCKREPDKIKISDSHIVYCFL